MMIVVDDLVRTFRVPAKSGPSFLRLPLPGRSMERRAVNGVSFRVEAGECVGYLGPNGAGKSTTIKILSGILYPSAGHVEVAGMVPWRQREAYVRHIGVVFGQRTQLWWDLPLNDSFSLLRDIYRVPAPVYRRNMDMLSDLLNLGEIAQVPVRQLSLGQRARAELAASLIHDPILLFLDEPTIGLDLLTKEAIHQFIRTLHQERGVTVLLTTHNVDDIEKLCQRVIFIDRGRKIFDGSADLLCRTYGAKRRLVVEARSWPDTWSGPPLMERRGAQAWFSIDTNDSIPQQIAEINRLVDITNLAIEEPRIEDVIKNVYRHGGEGSGA